MRRRARKAITVSPGLLTCSVLPEPAVAYGLKVTSEMKFRGFKTRSSASPAEGLEAAF
jgi:hypothetical protein